MDRQSYLDAMAKAAGSVAVLTALDGEKPKGVTISSFCSVSADPPLLLVVLDALGAALAAVEASGRFNLSVLNRQHEWLADRFAQRAPAPAAGWRDIPHRPGSNGIALIDEAVAWFECELDASHAAGDHVIVVGRVTGANRGAGDPLVLFDRGFWALQ